MYNFTIIDNDGQRYQSIDTLKLANYGLIRLDPSGELSSMWLGNKAPDELSIYINEKDLNVISNDGFLLLNLAKMIALSSPELDMSPEQMEMLIESELLLTLAGTKIYTNVKPKIIGFNHLFLENPLNFNDYQYMVDLSNLSQSASCKLMSELVLLALLQYMMVESSEQQTSSLKSSLLPLFCNNKLLTLDEQFVEGMKVSTKTNFNNLNLLTIGLLMFFGCENISDFVYELPLLKSAPLMFAYSGIKNFNINLPKLMYADGMDNENSLIDISGEDNELIHILKYYGGMFANSQLETFAGDLPNLINGQGMFAGCENMTSFTGSLSSLKYGYNMFGRGVDIIDEDEIAATGSDSYLKYLYTLAYPRSAYLTYNIHDNGTKLDSTSVLYILETLPKREEAPIDFDINSANNIEGLITIGINAYEDTKDNFAKEIGYNNFDELTSAFINKGWFPDWILQKTATYSLRKNNEVYVKIKEFKDKITISPAISKKYNIPETLAFDSIKDGILKQAIQPKFKDANGKLYSVCVTNSDKHGKGWEKFDSLEAALEHYKLVSINKG